MKTPVVRIGNSRGIRIPRALIEQCHLGDTVELEVEEGKLVVSPAATPRQGWAEAFREMAERGDDALLDPDIPRSKFDATDWEW